MLLRTLTLSAVAATALAAQAPSATKAWPRSTPADQGLVAAPLDAFVGRAKAGNFGNVDRLVVVRNGYLVLDERFARDYTEISRGKVTPIGCGADACKDASEVHDFNYLHPTTHPYYKGRDVHTLQSVTKSVTATLFGIALERGELKDFNAPLLSYFTKYDFARVAPQLRRATLADLLTMRTGIEWHETDRPLDSTNTTLQLEHSRDWIQFTLNQPSDAEPGQRWTYNSGGSAMMAEALRVITGKHAHDYAREHLFTPLGIRDFHWKLTPTGHPDTEGGLYLSSSDLAKIGQLFINDGMWDGKRILAVGFAKTATDRIVQRTNPAAPASPGYGYQWWRYDRRGTDIWAGNGFGGQFLIIVPSQKLVAVINSWNVFGVPAAGSLNPLIDAVLDAAGVPR
jgi:CubicO group peptidase (beta-lactamase class C family)